MAESKKLKWGTKDWKRKLKQQAVESKEYRLKLYKMAGLKNKKKILDVGCGTGAVTRDIARLTKGKVLGIDIDKKKLKHAEKLLSNIPNVKLKEADVLKLPFKDNVFDLVVFNIVLVYIKDQQKALNEMARVTQNNGIVLATLEPDYASRIDHPENPMAPLILKTMKNLGADLTTGRKLKALFNKTGLQTKVGIDTETDYIFIKDDKLELKRFLDEFWVTEKLLKKDGWTPEKIEKYREEQIMMIKSKMCFKFTPCFYAIGKKI